MRKRTLSEFMCIEMLYDYKSGKLDPLRHQAVEDVLQSSPRVREELKKLSIGISYCDKLKNISVSEPLVDMILNQPKSAERVLSKFRWGNFPQPVRWAFEAVVVAVAIALFVTQVPNLFKAEKNPAESMVVKKFDIKPPGPEVVEESEVEANPTVAKQSTEVVTEQAPKPTAPIIASKEIPLLLRPPEAPVAEADGQAPAATVATAPAQPAPEPPKPVAKKGNAYVYRMTMHVDDVDNVTPEIVALISGLGGEKAGEVELGWRRKGGSYFHFSIPKANSPNLQEGLKNFARFNIIKSTHPRVMPEDTERYILWVEKKSTPEAAQNESPESQETADDEAEPSATTSPTDEQDVNQEDNETN